MKKERKLNNKGLSLVELLIALAISSMILSGVTLLVTNGVAGYNKQTTTSTLQDDANLTMNHITNSIMESNTIDLVQTDDGTNTYMFITHDKSTEAQGVASNKYIYDKENKILYVADIDGNLSNASPLCTNVDTFKVQLTKDSLTTTGSVGVEKVVGISDVVQFKVTIVLKANNNEREVTRYTNTRNKLSFDTLKMSPLSETGSIVNLEIKQLTDKGYLVD